MSSDHKTRTSKSTFETKEYTMLTSSVMQALSLLIENSGQKEVEAELICNAALVHGLYAGLSIYSDDKELTRSAWHDKERERILDLKKAIQAAITFATNFSLEQNVFKGNSDMIDDFIGYWVDLDVSNNFISEVFAVEMMYLPIKKGVIALNDGYIEPILLLKAVLELNTAIKQAKLIGISN